MLHRIVESAGLKRAGGRIQSVVEMNLSMIVRERKVIQKGNFIWHSTMNSPLIRDRSELEVSSKKIEYISPEEIQVAIIQVIERGFSVNYDNVLSDSASVLGFQRVTEQIKKTLDTQVDGLIKKGEIISRNGVISRNK